MKAILINPEEKSITEVEHDDSINDIKELIQAELFDVVRINEVGDVLFVDDEGLYNADHFFCLQGCDSPLAGRALLLGTDHEGRSVEPMLESVETLEDKVSFISIEEAVAMAEDVDRRAGEMAADYGDSFIYFSVADILKDREYTEPSE